MVRVWKGLGQTAKTSKPAAVIQPSRKGMIITIAREHGSAGKRIGQLVAQRLGIPCYYKELVAIAAQESGLAQEFISNINLDENAVMRELYLTTDDGSYVRKGFVTDVLKELLPVKKYDCVFAVGPMPMMRAVCNVTKEYGVHTVVSMNSIMVDGTGMCGGCRVRVGGKIKYACVDGPEFDGHEIDWDESLSRLRAYKEHEDACRLRR